MTLTPEPNPEINLEDYLNLAYHNAIKFQKITDLDFDDVWGLCNLALVLAKRTFNPELGYQFTTYATKAMWGQIMNERNRRKTPPTIHLEDISKGDSVMTWDALIEDSFNYEKAVINKIDLESAIKKLTPRQQEVFDIQVTHPELLKKERAKLLGISYTRLRQLNAKIYPVIKEALAQ